MSIVTSDVHPASTRTDPGGPSILLRVAGILVLLLFGLGALLFLAVDHLITAPFSKATADRARRHIADISQMVEHDARQLQGQVALAATDSDLVHSTQYSVRLRGEAKAAQEDVERIAIYLGFPAVFLLSESGEKIAGHADDRGSEVVSSGSNPDLAAPPTTATRWHAHALWLISESPVSADEMPMARLRAARRASLPLNALGEQVDMRAVPAAEAEADDEVILYTEDLSGSKVALKLVVDDRPLEIVRSAKRMLVLAFVLGCGLTAASMVYVLRRELLPLRELTRAAAAVGRGDFSQRVYVSGAAEVASLARAFNGMTDDLARLRGIERTLREQEKVTAIGRLATRLAHDINNPLTVIQNAALLMQRRPDNDVETRADLALVIHHSRRCAAILKDLLAFGRPLRLDVQPLDLVEFCEGVLERARLRNARGNWVGRFPARSVVVAADGPRLEQLLENLLNNAFEAGGRAPVELTCGVREGRAYIEVRDRGPGFTADALSHLFELFYTSKQHGTGLGLANAQAIARAHGGSLVVENRLEGGAVVRIELLASKILSES